MELSLPKPPKPRTKRPTAKIVPLDAALRPVLITDGSTAFRAQQLRERIERYAFRYYQQRSDGRSDSAADWSRAERDLLRPVAVELREVKGGLLLRAELPGVRPADLEIAIERRRVQICGHVAAIYPPGQSVYSELRECDLLRSVGLPFEIEPSRFELGFQLGMLELTLRRPRSWSK